MICQEINRLNGVVRSKVGIKLVDRIKASVGATGYFLGYPGETIAYGFFLAAEIGITF